MAGYNPMPLAAEVPNTSLSSVVEITLLAGCDYLTFQATSQNVRFSFDSVPTASVGWQATAGVFLTLWAPKGATYLKVIEETASAKIRYRQFAQHKDTNA